ncbi:MAG: hypothetical protein WC406_11505 [Methanoregula sp.]
MFTSYSILPESRFTTKQGAGLQVYRTLPDGAFLRGSSAQGNPPGSVRGLAIYGSAAEITYDNASRMRGAHAKF